MTFSINTPHFVIDFFSRFCYHAFGAFFFLLLLILVCTNMYLNIVYFHLASHIASINPTDLTRIVSILNQLLAWSSHNGLPFPLNRTFVFNAISILCIINVLVAARLPLSLNKPRAEVEGDNPVLVNGTTHVTFQRKLLTDSMCLCVGTYHKCACICPLIVGIIPLNWHTIKLSAG